MKKRKKRKRGPLNLMDATQVEQWLKIGSKNENKKKKNYLDL